LAAVDCPQLDGNFEAVLCAFTAPVPRHGFHAAKYAEIHGDRRINFQPVPKVECLKSPLDKVKRTKVDFSHVENCLCNDYARGGPASNYLPQRGVRIFLDDGWLFNGWMACWNGASRIQCARSQIGFLSIPGIIPSSNFFFDDWLRFS
jgi:hypothetical protein